MEIGDYYCTLETKFFSSPPKSRKPKLVYPFFFIVTCIKNASLLKMRCIVCPANILSLQNKLNGYMKGFLASILYKYKCILFMMIYI